MLNFFETIDLTVIVALIAAISAILAPLITEIIRQKGIHKEKSIELYFNAKMESYVKYLHIAARFPPSPSKDDLLNLSEALYQVIIFSSKDTSRKIAIYINYLREWSYQESFGESDWSAYNDAFLDMLSALYDELEKYCK